MATSLKIIFAGTPAFAAVALQALIDSTHQIIAVYTQPDRKAGRGLKLVPSPVKTLALAHAIPVYQPISLKNPEEQARLAALEADVMVVAAYGMLLPEAILNLPRLGCINIHPSLLPRFRGAAPIQRSIFYGDAMSGVSIMQMDKGLDTGPILLQREYQLNAHETSQTLHDHLAQLGARSLMTVLDLLAQNKMKAQPQDNNVATYANKITKEEAQLNWHESAVQLDRKIRAFQPWPIAYTLWRGQALKIWDAKVLKISQKHTPGTLIAASHAGLDIATGEDILRLLKVQLPGAKVLSVADFYNANRKLLHVGESFS